MAVLRKYEVGSFTGVYYNSFSYVCKALQLTKKQIVIRQSSLFILLRVKRNLPFHTSSTSSHFQKLYAKRIAHKRNPFTVVSMSASQLRSIVSAPVPDLNQPKLQQFVHIKTNFPSSCSKRPLHPFVSASKRTEVLAGLLFPEVRGSCVVSLRLGIIVATRQTSWWVNGITVKLTSMPKTHAQRYGKANEIQWANVPVAQTTIRSPGTDLRRKTATGERRSQTGSSRLRAE